MVEIVGVWVPFLHTGLNSTIKAWVTALPSLGSSGTPGLSAPWAWEDPGSPFLVALPFFHSSLSSWPKLTHQQHGHAPFHGRKGGRMNMASFLLQDMTSPLHAPLDWWAVGMILVTQQCWAWRVSGRCSLQLDCCVSCCNSGGMGKRGEVCWDS